MTISAAARDTNVFDLRQSERYRRWRDQKLAHFPARIEDLMVEIRNPLDPTPAEIDAVLERCRRANMAIYVSPSRDAPEKEIPRLIGGRLGLARMDHNMGADEDAISSLTVRTDALRRGYIPYSNRPLAWHTDGYYNSAEQQIRGFLLHCVRPARSGGENHLLDHEVLYILLRDREPEFIRALMDPQAMCIPANVVEGKEMRPARSGPVFSVVSDGHLHMRYTDRTRSILWRDDSPTREAVAVLKGLLGQETAWRFRARLESGWGLISNNILHTRTGFEDGERPRLIYRARYYDRISGARADVR